MIPLAGLKAPSSSLSTLPPASRSGASSNSSDLMEFVGFSLCLLLVIAAHASTSKEPTGSNPASRPSSPSSTQPPKSSGCNNVFSNY